MKTRELLSKIGLTRLKSQYLGVIFIFAVIVPSILLAVLSIRAAGREEAYVEKQLQTALLAEVIHTATLADAEVKEMAEELRESLDVPPGEDGGSALSRWKAATPLVGVPFLLSARYAILQPRLSATLHESERSFLEENAEFLANKTSITLYRNIALLYKEEILAESTKMKNEPSRADAQGGGAGPLGESAAEEAAQQAAGGQRETAPSVEQAVAQNAAPPAPQAAQDAASVAARPAAMQASPPPAPQAAGQEAAPRSLQAAENPPAGFLAKKDNLEQPREEEKLKESPQVAAEAPAAPDRVPSSSSAQSDVLSTQKAIDVFTASEPIRQKVYRQAKEKGETLNKRIVSPAAQTSKPSAAEDQQQSFLVTETGKFSQIASGAEYGIIPRFVGERLTFLFWERQKDGRIAGCGIDSTAFKDRIAGVITASYSTARILAILDERGNPLAPPQDAGSRDWRRPFVSQEIGESLPRWEAASYLSDPHEISSRAHASSLVIWVLVLILFVSVASGGTLVLTSLAGEVRLARNKATFVTNVSHELKTPLTSISLFAELLRKGKRTDPRKVEQYLSQISGETERLTRLINNVLDFSSMERGTKKYAWATVDIADVCREAVEGQRVGLESRGFSLEFLSGKEDLSVSADAEAIRQALLNLLSNAEKYSPQNKEIEVEVSQEGSAVGIHVRDRGMGVAEKHRERIFQEFFRADDSLTSRVRGTGLGLSIARRIARDHGGDITYSPRPGGGSEFTIRLPRARSGRAEGGEEP